MGKSLLMECVSVPVPDDVVIPLMRLSRSEPCSSEAEVFRGDGRVHPDVCHS